MVTAAFMARDSCDHPRVLIACGSMRHARTVWTMSELATRLDAAGVVVELGVAANRAMPTPADYDLIVAALSGRPWIDRPLLHWIDGYGRDFCLATIGAFIVGNPRRAARAIAKLSANGWQPLGTCAADNVTTVARAAARLLG